MWNHVRRSWGGVYTLAQSSTSENGMYPPKHTFGGCIQINTSNNKRLFFFFFHSTVIHFKYLETAKYLAMHPKNTYENNFISPKLT